MQGRTSVPTPTGHPKLSIIHKRGIRSFTPYSINKILLEKVSLYIFRDLVGKNDKKYLFPYMKEFKTKSIKSSFTENPILFGKNDKMII